MEAKPTQYAMIMEAKAPTRQTRTDEANSRRHQNLIKRECSKVPVGWPIPSSVRPTRQTRADIRTSLNANAVRFRVSGREQGTFFKEHFHIGAVGDDHRGAAHAVCDNHGGEAHEETPTQYAMIMEAKPTRRRPRSMRTLRIGPDLFSTSLNANAVRFRVSGRYQFHFIYNIYLYSK